LLAATAAASINHLLQGASWAPRRLQSFAGKTALFHIAPLALALTVLDTGELAPAPVGIQPDVSLRLSPALALRVLARDAAALAEVQIEGDADLAAEIKFIAERLPWDFEQDLSRVFGDVLAHRIGGMGRRLAQWQASTLDNLGHALVEYWTEERPLLAKRADVERFVHEVDTLRDSLARMEKRVEKLSGG
jgi:ubiquinone biosynthesis protein UbiJ